LAPWVEGADRASEASATGALIKGIGDRITYNPYKYESFVHAVDESPFEGSAWAVLNAWGRVFVA
jgi:hypothetical protein